MRGGKLRLSPCTTISPVSINPGPVVSTGGIDPALHIGSVQVVYPTGKTLKTVHNGEDLHDVERVSSTRRIEEGNLSLQVKRSSSYITATELQGKETSSLYVDNILRGRGMFLFKHTACIEAPVVNQRVTRCCGAQERQTAARHCSREGKADSSSPPAGKSESSPVGETTLTSISNGYLEDGRGGLYERQTIFTNVRQSNDSRDSNYKDSNYKGTLRHIHVSSKLHALEPSRPAASRSTPGERCRSRTSGSVHCEPCREPFHVAALFENQTYEEKQ